MCCDGLWFWFGLIGKLPKDVKYVRDVLPPTPDRGELDINEVLRSRYFFKCKSSLPLSTLTMRLERLR
jgi:hypothetical protein